MKQTKTGTDAAYDPGATLCGHPDRIHYMGGGLWVCFACLVRAISPRYISMKSKS